MHQCTTCSSHNTLIFFQGVLLSHPTPVGQLSVPRTPENPDRSPGDHVSSACRATAGKPGTVALLIGASAAHLRHISRVTRQPPGLSPAPGDRRPLLLCHGCRRKSRRESLVLSFWGQDTCKYCCFSVLVGGDRFQFEGRGYLFDVSHCDVFDKVSTRPKARDNNNVCLLNT